MHHSLSKGLLLAGTIVFITPTILFQPLFATSAHAEMNVDCHLEDGCDAGGGITSGGNVGSSIDSYGGGGSTGYSNGPGSDSTNTPWQKFQNCLDTADQFCGGFTSRQKFQRCEDALAQQCFDTYNRETRQRGKHRK